MTTEKLIITPRTKVGELLKAYPGLEEKLIEMAPVFRKLKNPVLRRTIARVTSLQQAAAVGEIPVEKLVNTLRELTGQGTLEGIRTEDNTSEEKPSWFDEKKIVKVLDATPLLNQGGHPLGEVLKDTKEINPGEIYELRTPFLPVPLIERVMEQGFDSWSVKQGEEKFVTYFTPGVSGTEHPKGIRK
jgi:hypothetical protein